MRADTLGFKEDAFEERTASSKRVLDIAEIPALRSHT